MHGVAVHINAFNFPVWGMLEKLAPAFLAGMPTIVKPATADRLRHRAACVRLMIDSGILPERLPAADRRRSPPGTCSTILTAAGRRGLHRFRRHRAAPLRPTPTSSRSSALQRGGRLPQRRHPGSRRHSRAPRSTTLFMKEVVRRDDLQGRAEVHRHPARHGAAATVEDRRARAIAERVQRRMVMGDPRTRASRMGAAGRQGPGGEVREAPGAPDRRRRHRRLGRPESPRSATPTREGRLLPRHLRPLDDPATPGGATSSRPSAPSRSVLGYGRTTTRRSRLARRRRIARADRCARRRRIATQVVAGHRSHHGRVLPESPDAKESTGHGSPLPQPGPRRSRPRRRRRGAGRRARRHALHAAHRNSGSPGPRSRR